MNEVKNGEGIEKEGLMVEENEKGERERTQKEEEESKLGTDTDY